MQPNNNRLAPGTFVQKIEDESIYKVINLGVDWKNQEIQHIVSYKDSNNRTHFMEADQFLAEFKIARGMEL